MSRKPRYQFGDYVMLPDGTCAFVTSYRHTDPPSVSLVWWTVEGTKLAGLSPVYAIGPASREPSEAECVAWAKWSLLNRIAK